MKDSNKGRGSDASIFNSFDSDAAFATPHRANFSAATPP
jgi:hypothetical protein